MTDRECAEAIADFLREGFDPPLGLEAIYPYAIANTTGALPDVVVFVAQHRELPAPPEGMFPAELTALQEVWFRVFELEASVMVEVPQDPDQTPEQAVQAADDADAQIRMICERLGGSIRQDASLGGRLTPTAAASPFMHFDHSTPFVAREDQTRGRYAVIELAVAEPIEASD